MLKLKPYAHYLIVFGLAILLMALGRPGQGGTAWANGTNFQRGTVPTRTPTPDPNKESDDDESGSNTANQGQIVGQVTDLSTGRPGANIIVRLNSIEVNTDTFGKYSLSGLNAGEVVIVLVLEGDATPAQEPITITIDGKTTVKVDLAYFSDPSQVAVDANPTTASTEAVQSASVTPASPSETTSEATAETTTETTKKTGAATTNNTPETLPESGTLGYNRWFMLAAGLMTLILGLSLRRVGES